MDTKVQIGDLITDSGFTKLIIGVKEDTGNFLFQQSLLLLQKGKKKEYYYIFIC